MSKPSYEALNASFRILSSLLQDFQPSDLSRISDGSDTLTQMKMAFQSSHKNFDGLLTAHRDLSKPAATDTKTNHQSTAFKMPTLEESCESFKATFSSQQTQSPVINFHGSTHSSLLSLPIELRYKIWGYAITPSFGHIDLQQPEGRPNLALAQVNHEIHAEVQYILHHDIKLCLSFLKFDTWQTTMAEAKQLFQPEQLSIEDNQYTYAIQWAVVRDEMLSDLTAKLARNYAIGKDPQLLARFCNITLRIDIGYNHFRLPVRAASGRKDERAEFGFRTSEYSQLDSWFTTLANVMFNDYAAQSSPQTIALKWNLIEESEEVYWWPTRSASAYVSHSHTEEGWRRMICTWRDYFGGSRAVAQALADARPNLRVLSEPIVVIDDFHFIIEELDKDTVQGSVVDIAPAGRCRSGVDSVSFKFVRTRLVEFECKWPTAVAVD